MSIATVAEERSAICCQDGEGRRWARVCKVEDLATERGVAAIVDGRQVALFRLHDDAIAAVGNRDPFSGANVISRGLVGSLGEIPVVFSPMYKQAFSLLDGRCLSEPGVAIPSYPVRIRAGEVELSLPGEESAQPGYQEAASTSQAGRPA